MPTEEEAKKKWCPMVRLRAHTWAQDGLGKSFEGGYSWNRSPALSAADDDPDTKPYLPQACNCIGSACMMWRWAEKRNPDWKPRNSMMVSSCEEHPDDRVPTHIEDHELGCCGLAGKP